MLKTSAEKLAQTATDCANSIEGIGSCNSGSMPVASIAAAASQANASIFPDVYASEELGLQGGMPICSQLKSLRFDRRHCIWHWSLATFRYTEDVGNIDKNICKTKQSIKVTINFG